MPEQQIRICLSPIPICFLRLNVSTNSKVIYLTTLGTIHHATALEIVGQVSPSHPDFYTKKIATGSEATATSSNSAVVVKQRTNRQEKRARYADVLSDLELRDVVMDHLQDYYVDDANLSKVVTSWQHMTPYKMSMHKYSPPNYNTSSHDDDSDCALW